MNDIKCISLQDKINRLIEERKAEKSSITLTDRYRFKHSSVSMSMDTFKKELPEENPYRHLTGSSGLEEFIVVDIVEKSEE